MSSRTCRCRGDCGSGRCIGHILWGKPCGARDGSHHLVDGSRVSIERNLCHLCRAAVARTRHNQQQRADRITSGDGQTSSLFSLLAHGGFS